MSRAENAFVSVCRGNSWIASTVCENRIITGIFQKTKVLQSVTDIEIPPKRQVLGDTLHKNPSGESGKSIKMQYK